MTTPPYKVHPSVLVRQLMSTWIKRNWWWIVIPPVAAATIALAYHDMRFLLVALIWIFLIAPPVMIIVYFYHALSPEARYSIRLHTITTTSEGIIISYPPESHDEDEEDNTKSFPEDVITRDHITSYKIHPKYTILYLYRNPYKIIIIPHSIWESTQDAYRFIKSIAPSQ